MSSSEALVFGNRWVVKGTVGKGAFSEIFAAEDLTAEDGSELVAIKFHNANVDSSVMKWEGDVFVALAGVPCVPHLIHYGKENGRDYLVMFVSDRVIGSLEYSGHGFNWNDGQCIQDVMARFRHQAVMHAHALINWLWCATKRCWCEWEWCEWEWCKLLQQETHHDQR